MTCAGRRRVVSTVVAALLVRCASQAPEGSTVKQTIQYIWPASTFQIQLSSTDANEGIDDSGLADKLADVAIAGYERYVKDILPKDLEADPAFAAIYAKSDSSRDNNAFLRWQKRIFAALAGLPMEDLNWNGESYPPLAGLAKKGVSFEWPEFFKSKEYKSFRSHARALANKYLGLSADEEAGNVPFKVFAWAEVYVPGSYVGVHVHTGVPATGMFVARYNNSGTKEVPQRLVFEDMRGINPPYGRHHRHTPVQGEVLLWPSFLPHMMTPNAGVGTQVNINFLAMPPGGTAELDWEDDALGDVKKNRQTQIQRKVDSNHKVEL